MTTRDEVLHNIDALKSLAQSHFYGRTGFIELMESLGKIRALTQCIPDIARDVPPDLRSELEWAVAQLGWAKGGGRTKRFENAIYGAMKAIGDGAIARNQYCALDFEIMELIREAEQYAAARNGIVDYDSAGSVSTFKLELARKNAAEIDPDRPFFGKEAEDLRKGIETVLAEWNEIDAKGALQTLLDTTDARDSLAYLRANEESHPGDDSIDEKEDYHRCDGTIDEFDGAVDEWAEWVDERARNNEAKIAQLQEALEKSAELTDILVRNQELLRSRFEALFSVTESLQKAKMDLLGKLDAVNVSLRKFSTRIDALGMRSGEIEYRLDKIEQEKAKKKE